VHSVPSLLLLRCSFVLTLSNTCKELSVNVGEKPVKEV